MKRPTSTAVSFHPSLPPFPVFLSYLSGIRSPFSVPFPSRFGHNTRRQVITPYRVATDHFDYRCTTISTRQVYQGKKEITKAAAFATEGYGFTNPIRTPSHSTTNRTSSRGTGILSTKNDNPSCNYSSFSPCGGGTGVGPVYSRIEELPPPPCWVHQFSTGPDAGSSVANSSIDDDNRVLSIIDLQGLEVSEQLILEEALYRVLPAIYTSHYRNVRTGQRSSSSNSCATPLISLIPPFLLVNYILPSSPPTVVLGLSGDLVTLTDASACLRDGVMMQRRFTGGGTIYVDSNIALASLLLPRYITDRSGSTKSGDDIVTPTWNPTTTTTSDPNRSSGSRSSRTFYGKDEFPIFPVSMMRWTSSVYRDWVFGNPSSPNGSDHTFDYCENDYVARNVHYPIAGEGQQLFKIGGNAQSFSSGVFVHHTSFIVNRLDKNKLNKYLKEPIKEPVYRKKRSHDDFITSIHPLLTEAICGTYSKNVRDYLTATRGRSRLGKTNPPPLDGSQTTADGSHLTVPTFVECLKMGWKMYALAQGFDVCTIRYNDYKQWFHHVGSYFKHHMKPSSRIIQAK